MPHPKLLRLAEAEVQRNLERLPADVREAAAECVVSFEDISDVVAGEDAMADDLLGLFEGLSRLDPLPGGPEDMPRIRLFLDNLWEYAGNDERVFRREVRITWLHELGHYLGWGEEEVEELGLG
jgi:predicted Zn-dependent protease with MMP-like domain